MRCIDGCGYHQKPDNLDALVRHLEDCLARGACQRLKKDPFVVWKDGGFAVVEKVTKKDRVFPITLIKKEAIELTKDMIKTSVEASSAQKKGVNASVLALRVPKKSPIADKKATEPKTQGDKNI
jgi:hypothetical protein